VEGYNPPDCSVVTVTGREPSGTKSSSVLAPSPVDRRLSQPTVVSPDAACGATGNGGPTIELLVRASAGPVGPIYGFSS
jgi:hypothetical protein